MKNTKFIQLKANIKFPIIRMFIQMKGGKNEKRK
jgi:hypothetical protein